MAFSLRPKFDTHLLPSYSIKLVQRFPSLFLAHSLHDKRELHRILIAPHPTHFVELPCSHLLARPILVVYLEFLRSTHVFAKKRDIVIVIRGLGAVIGVVGKL